jgi:mycoredoxin
VPDEAAHVTMYGAADCEDTAHVRERLRQLGVAFQEVDIDRDAVAAQFVTFVNGGQRSTPTLLIGTGHIRTIATEPSDAELEAALAAYRPG